MIRTHFPGIIILLILIVFTSCKKEDDPIIESKTRFQDYQTCSIIVPPANLGLNAHYQKYLNCSGIPIVSSSLATDASLYRADSIMSLLLTGREDVKSKMKEFGYYMGVIADGEATTDMPEFASLASDPGRNYTTEPVGVFNHGYRMAITPEANLMCLPSDLYGGLEDLTVHEFSHPIDFAFRAASNSYFQELDSAYQYAKANGIFANTYGISNNYEYFAEGIQIFYNVAVEGPPGGDGNHNEIDTRAELQTYDVRLYNLIAKYFTSSTNVPTCN